MVYNPLPWTRSGIVELNGETVFVKDVPPCGYRTQPLPPASMRMAPRKTSEPATHRERVLQTHPRSGSRRHHLARGQAHRARVGGFRGARGLGSYLNERFTFEQTLNYALAYQSGRALGSGAKGEWPHPGMHKPGMISEKEVPYRAATAGRGTATD